MAVPGDPAFRSLGAGRKRYRTPPQGSTWSSCGLCPAAAAPAAVGKPSTGHQPGSLICDIDRAGGEGGRREWGKIHKPFGRTTIGDQWMMMLRLRFRVSSRRSRPTQSSGTDANVDGGQLSSQPCCLVNTWRDQSPMERMQLRRLFGLGSNTYLAGIKRQPGLSRPGRFASHQRLACLGARVRLFCKNHAAAPKYRPCFSPGIADILSTKVGLVLK
ncbi:hypothetical protein H109_05572 [Trichophyton interdigitale MR816]|uniref:Uncharacterized protein n=1 Tax=Trichophyton interdigitale (strain MR816) TaxID=1215338 RepID=A0A059J3P3_TRIIM|nr:hypothetical protein H109_05572 [Trichophyton interdigitale MR816]